MMDNPLDPVAVRVLGALMEKEIATPDNYPLTLNALVAACNQTTNRTPVMTLDEATVSRSLEDLSRRSLAREVHRSDSRAKRYRQTISEAMHLHRAETAVMGVLMLRGAQTAGEIRTRSARLFEFLDVSHVELTLQSLMTMSSPLVVQLERRPGQKEVRYAHLLSGEPSVGEAGEEGAQAAGDPQPGRHGDTVLAVEAGRIEALEETVDSLRAELADLRAQFEEFRRAFQ